MQRQVERKCDVTDQEEGKRIRSVKYSRVTEDSYCKHSLELTFIHQIRLAYVAIQRKKNGPDKKISIIQKI